MAACFLCSEFWASFVAWQRSGILCEWACTRGPKSRGHAKGLTVEIALRRSFPLNITRASAWSLHDSEYLGQNSYMVEKATMLVYLCLLGGGSRYQPRGSKAPKSGVCRVCMPGLFQAKEASSRLVILRNPTACYLMASTLARLVTSRMVLQLLQPDPYCQTAVSKIQGPSNAESIMYVHHVEIPKNQSCTRTSEGSPNF